MKGTTPLPHLSTLTRRSLLFSAASLAAAPKSKLKIGVTDWNLRAAASPDAVRLAAEIGFDGVEISFGRPKAGAPTLPADSPETLAAYRAAFSSTGISAAGCCVDILHEDCLHNAGPAAGWLQAGIRLTAALGGRVLLMPSFFKCELATPENIRSAVSVLKQVAPAAEKAGVTLGLENTLSASACLEIMEKAGSPNLKVYYDAANAVRWNHDPFAEIPLLGASRICQFHIKDYGGYLGEGTLAWDRLMRLILHLGFEGWANLETATPAGDVRADMRRNLSYIRSLIASG